MSWIWTILIILLVIAEGMTAALVSIWFMLGAVVALILSLNGASVQCQEITFLVVSVLSLFLCRPLMKMSIKKKKKHPEEVNTETNAFTIIGQEAKVTEEINRFNETGAVYIQGKTWTAKNVDTADSEPIKAGEIVTIESISGVKVFVKRQLNLNKPKIEEEEK